MEEQVGTPSIDSLLNFSAQMERSEAFMVEIRNSFDALHNDTEERLHIVMVDMLVVESLITDLQEVEDEVVILKRAIGILMGVPLNQSP